VTPRRTKEHPVTSFKRRLRAWYRRSGRHDLPWRLTRDPYAVLVSEVMLQQTQVHRVVPYYEAWLSRWPTPAALAEAPVAEVIRAWSGLGYNRRALNLHRAAQAAQREFGGAIPTSPDHLRELPGVGEYTASAVACFAGGARVPVVDTNIARVLGRAIEGRGSVRAADARSLVPVAESLLPARNGTWR
jgi:A/G-specific adenine glycosylase